MKKIISLVLSFIMVGTLAACGNSNNVSSSQLTSEATKNSTAADTQAESSDSSTSTKQSNSTETGKSLVVYFSVPEATEAANMNSEEENSTVVIDGEVLGNTQYVAYVIEQTTGAEVFRIEPETPYPMDHAELEAVATKEKQDNAYPAILAKIDNIEQYDTIFVGYPNWYADMPRIMYSFFEEYDLSGKRVIPFVTSGGSGFSNTISTITDLEPDAEVIADGFSVSRTKVQDAESDIVSWLNGLGY